MRLRRFLSLWGPVLLQTGLLFYLSSQRMLPHGPRFTDKVAHFVAYGLLALLFLRALHGGFVPLNRPRALFAIALAIAYGVSDEFHQSFVPGRDASGYDLLADALGAITATLLAGAVLRRGTPPGKPRGDELRSPRRTGDLL